MIRDASEESPDERVLDCRLDFDPGSVRSFRVCYNIRHEGTAWSELSDDDFLVQIGAADDEKDTLRPTASGLLMFGRERLITKVYPDYFLDYREHMSTDLRWMDRIIFANPGTIITGKKQMLKGGISQPRNKGLFKLFNLIGYGEHAGSGVSDIFKTWSDAGLDAPIVEELFGDVTPDRTILTLPLVGNSVTGFVTGDEDSDEAGDEDKKQLIIDFCQESRSKAEIQKYLNIRSERYIRQKLITPLLEEGSLSRTIPEKPSSPKQKYIATDI